MSVHGVSPSLTAPIAYDRSGQTRPDSARTSTSGRSGEAMRVEITPQARARAAVASVTAATTEAAASADLFASPGGMDALTAMLPGVPRGVRL